MLILGIDPGATGGLAWIQVGENSPLVKTMPMPTVKAKGHTYNDRKILYGLITSADFVVLEKQQSMGKTTMMTTFTLGRGYGELLMACTLAGVRFAIARPQDWQKGLLSGVPTSGKGKGKIVKQLAMEFVKMRWPETDFKATPKCTTMHDGMVDAACIAEYGRRALL